MLGWSVALPSGRARCRFTTRADGDLRVTLPPERLAERRAGVVDMPWVGLQQVHGPTVVVVDGPEHDGSPHVAREGDALVTKQPCMALSVNVADCAPIALFSPQHVIGAVHAGWRGAELGVIESTVETMRSLGADRIGAWLGPCIHAECYEFGEMELERLTERFGPAVRSRTSSGDPAFDLPMAVAVSLGRAGVELVGAADACTACDPRRFYSFRARREGARHALAVWMEPVEGPG